MISYPYPKKINMELWSFMRDNLPFALYGNVNNEYSKEEYHLAEEIIMTYLKKFKRVNEKLLIESIACLLKHIKYVRDSYDTIMTTEYMKEKGKFWNEYHKMIFEFNRVIESFNLNPESNYSSLGKIFPVEKIIFKGNRKGQEITLSGHVLTYLKAMFNSFNSVYTEGQKEKMKEFSFQLHSAHEEFISEWLILNAEEGTLAKDLINNREESNKETAFNRYKHKTAFYIHQFLKKNSSNTKAVCPAWHCKLIGTIYSHLDMVEYLDYTDNKKIQNWIERGSPNNTTRTKKSKK